MVRVPNEDVENYDLRETSVVFKKHCEEVFEFIPKRKPVKVSKIARQFPEIRIVGDILEWLEYKQKIVIDKSKPITTVKRV